MEYRSVAQMAEQWGVSDRRVRILCQQGKIGGVIRKGRAWLIPADAEKPIDGRTTRYQRNDSPYVELIAEVDTLKQTLINVVLSHKGNYSDSVRNSSLNIPTTPMPSKAIR